MNRMSRGDSRGPGAPRGSGRSRGIVKSPLAYSMVVPALCAFLCACATGSGSPRSGGRQPSATAGDSARLRVVFGDPFSPDVGPVAVKAFMPEVAAVDSGGECALRKLPGNSKATNTTAYFPNRAASLMTVSITFDSAGHLVQYSEMRGVTGLRGLPPGTSSVQRDSLLKAAQAAARTTSISFNYALDQAIARNRGGGKPDNAVLASVHELESLPKLGPVKDRLVRVRKLCGV